jgi:hypothetical protein
MFSGRLHLASDTDSRTISSALAYLHDNPTVVDYLHPTVVVLLTTCSRISVPGYSRMIVQEIPVEMPSNQFLKIISERNKAKPYQTLINLNSQLPMSLSLQYSHDHMTVTCYF